MIIYWLHLVKRHILSKKKKIQKCLRFTLNVIFSAAGKSSPFIWNVHSAPTHLLLIIFLIITLGNQDTKPTASGTVGISECCRDYMSPKLDSSRDSPGIHLFNIPPEARLHLDLRLVVLLWSLWALSFDWLLETEDTLELLTKPNEASLAAGNRE